MNQELIEISDRTLTIASRAKNHSECIFKAKYYNQEQVLRVIPNAWEYEMSFIKENKIILLADKLNIEELDNILSICSDIRIPERIH